MAPPIEKPPFRAALYGDRVVAGGGMAYLQTTHNSILAPKKAFMGGVYLIFSAPISDMLRQRGQ